MFSQRRPLVKTMTNDCNLENGIAEIKVVLNKSIQAEQP